MPRILYNTATGLLHPYPRQDDEPVVGLDPRYTPLDLIQELPPDHDPSTERLEPTETIDLDAGTVTCGWSLVDLSPPVPAPDWTTFKALALNSSTLNTILSAAYQACPVAAGALAPALLRAEASGPADFAAAWSTICAAVPEAVAASPGFQQVAQQCHIPAEFVEALQP